MVNAMLSYYCHALLLEKKSLFVLIQSFLSHGILGLPLARQLSQCWSPKLFWRMMSLNAAFNSELFHHERVLQQWVELLM